MKNPVKLLNLMLAAIRVIEAVRKMAGEEGYKFFLNLLGLQQVPVSKPAESAVVMQPIVERAPAPAVSAPAPPRPGMILSAPARPAPQLTTAPARIPQGPPPRREVRQQTPAPASAVSDFAAKISKVVPELGLEDFLTKFRKHFSLDGHGKEYWDRCRELLCAVLEEGSLEEESDWNLLTSVMKRNLFFTNGKNASLFLASCPHDILVDLLVSRDGLINLMTEIRREKQYNPASVHQTAFILDACMKAPEETRALFVSCQNAVHGMKKYKLIQSNHWLVQKVADMKRPHIPAEKYASPEEIHVPANEEVPSVPATEQEPEQVPQAAEEAAPVEPTPTAAAEKPATDPDSMTEAELEVATAPGVPINGYGKPEVLDSGFAATFEQQMLTGAGGAEPVGIPPAPATEVGVPENELVPV